MVNVITGRVWSLDTAAGLVTTDPVNISGIAVTWKAGSAGAVVLSETKSPDNTLAGTTILDAVSLGADSAAVNNLTQWFPIKGTFYGLRKVTMTDISKLYVYTE